MDLPEFAHNAELRGRDYRITDKEDGRFNFQFQIVYCHTLQESKGHTKVNTTFDSLHKNKISIHSS